MFQPRGSTGTLAPPCPAPHGRGAVGTSGKERLPVARLRQNGTMRDMLRRRVTLTQKGGGLPRRWFRQPPCPPPPPGARDRWSAHRRRRARPRGCHVARVGSRASRDTHGKSRDATRASGREGGERPARPRLERWEKREGWRRQHLGIQASGHASRVDPFLVLMVQRHWQEWRPGQDKVFNNANEDSEWCVHAALKRRLLQCSSAF